ncbi:MAG: alkaline phosphatase D family protein [Panacagrimonas sp.]
MSAPRRKKRRAGLSRREFLKRGAQSAAAMGIGPLLAGCDASSGGGRPVNEGEPVFRHGVASGDPLGDRVILWTRLNVPGGEDTPVRVTLATDPGFGAGLLEAEGMATPERDFTVKIDVTGLNPGTTYYYRFTALDQQSPIGRTRTLPEGEVERLRMAVLSCASYAHGFFNAYARVAQRADLDLVVHLGDYIYEYGNGEFGDARTYEPAHECISLEDYRTRHAYYKLEPEVQELHRQHPVVCVYDDHETANNAWRDGAANHQPELEGSWPLRKSAGQQAYEEWMPIRVPDAAHIYRSFSLGSLVDLLMLDTRLLARSQQLPPNLPPNQLFGLFTATGDYLDPARTLLGATQEQWLIERLRTSTARWKLIGQQVMFGQLKVLGLPNASGLSQFFNPDQWDGYPVARDRILAVLHGDDGHAPVDNTVILTGDIHTAFALDVTGDPNSLKPPPEGYRRSDGAGSLAVEFVTTSVTAAGLPGLSILEPVLHLENPHIRHANLVRKGYLLLDVTAERCQGEFWVVDTIAERSSTERLDAAFKTVAGGNHLTRASASTPRETPPAPAPAVAIVTPPATA